MSLIRRYPSYQVNLSRRRGGWLTERRKMCAPTPSTLSEHRPWGIHTCSTLRFIKRTQHRLLVMHRSEEHTSELQSRGHIVCRHLLEKKKTKRHASN